MSTFDSGALDFTHKHAHVINLNHDSSWISYFDLLLFLDFNFLLPSFSFDAFFSLPLFSFDASLTLFPSFSFDAFFFFLLSSSFDAFFLFTGSVSSSSLISVSLAIFSAFRGRSAATEEGLTSAHKNEECIISRCGLMLTL